MNRILFVLIILVFSIGIVRPNCPSTGKSILLYEIISPYWDIYYCENSPNKITPFTYYQYAWVSPPDYYIDFFALFDIPYAVTNPPNNGLSTHTFWMKYGGGNLEICSDDNNEPDYCQNRSTYCLVLDNYQVDEEGMNHFWVQLNTQCESCIGPLTWTTDHWGMLHYDEVFLTAAETTRYCSFGSPQTILSPGYINMVSCNQSTVYGCDSGELNNF